MADNEKWVTKKKDGKLKETNLKSLKKKDKKKGDVQSAFMCEHTLSRAPSRVVQNGGAGGGGRAPLA